MRARSLLRQVDAQFYTHEVEIMVQRAEMAAHEHAQQHGSTTPLWRHIAAHDVGGTHHVEGARRHTDLMEAVFMLKRLLLPQRPQT